MEYPQSTMIKRDTLFGSLINFIFQLAFDLSKWHHQKYIITTCYVICQYLNSENMRWTWVVVNTFAYIVMFILYLIVENFINSVIENVICSML